MTKNDRAATRARHGSRARGSRLMQSVAAVTAGVLGFAMVLGVTYWENLSHTFETQDISSLVTTRSHSPEPTTSTPSPSVTKEVAPTDWSAGNDINILLIGSDTRSGENGAIGGNVAGGMRSDTTIIMHISADRTRIDFLSIPRDSKVRVSDCKMLDGSIKKGWTGKFNIAFANGGSHGNVGEAAACTMQTIQDLTGITFDHYAVVDFAGFEKMINAVGGVPMCVTEKVKSKKAHLNLEVGPHVLSGKKALAWARARYGIGDGSDIGRIDRQQQLMNSLATKVLGMNVLTDAPQLTLLLKSAGESMTMDPDLGSFTYLLGLGYSLRNIDMNNVNFMTVPWKYPGDKSGNVVWTSEADTVFERIVQDLPMDGSTPTPVTSSTPDATSSGTVAPTVEPSPERLTQDEMIAQCEATLG